MTHSRIDLKDIVRWDTANWSKCLGFWEEHVKPDLSGAKALELGAREGGLSLWLANRGADVICSDISNPSEFASKVHSKYKLDGRIDYAAVNAVDIPYENHFDIICLKSVLGGIGSNNRKNLQVIAIDQIRRALKPGGVFLFAENMTGTVCHRFLRKRFVKWGASWRYVSLQEMRSMLSDFTSVSLKPYGFFGALGFNEYLRRLLGSADALFNPLIPAGWKYIVFGAATKRKD